MNLVFWIPIRCGIVFKGVASNCKSIISNSSIKIKTNTPKVLNARKTITELILSNHDANCTACVRNMKCELQSLANTLGIDVDFISRIYFSGILGIKDQQIFPLKKYSMNTLTSLYLEYHLRGIITDKGVKILENQLKLK